MVKNIHKEVSRKGAETQRLSWNNGSGIRRKNAAVAVGSPRTPRLNTDIFLTTEVPRGGLAKAKWVNMEKKERKTMLPILKLLIFKKAMKKRKYDPSYKNVIFVADNK
ncbi:MAG: hypothetical protein JNL88_12795 [Bacteroidia bacterium]|nr:hypothetical protein [Bacteroidia bacterium]